MKPRVPRRLVPALLALCLGCGDDVPQGPPPPTGDTVEPADLTPFQRDMLEEHNRVRAQAQPAPSPALEPLRWSAHAQQVAEAWAERCEFEHNAGRGSLGENLAAATPDHLTTRGVVQGWAAEAADYDYARNTCTAGKACGHYTQVVWRATTAVGCAVKTCSKNSPFGSRFPTWQLWVCNYSPPGNYVGQRPY